MSDATIPIGSELHKELFCRTLLATHNPYDPAEIPWPQLDAPALARLRSLPFWDLAVATEAQAAACIAALTRTERDPLLREAIALQGFEESRHQRLLEAMLQHYSIPLGQRADCRAIPDPEWAFLRLGYTECFDTFFACGLFRLASEAEFFPDELVTVFEPVMQEEARHILFFANWAAYRQAQRAWWNRPAFIVRRAV